MRLVFIGASGFGLSCLDLIRSLNCCEIAGVVTAPRKFSISYRPQGVDNVLHADFNAYCNEKGIPCATIDGGMKSDSLFTVVAQWKPDAFMITGWYHLIPSSWRRLAPAYGLHASLLPDYSGGAPLVWSIINGEECAGITLFQMDDGVDSGPIVSQSDTRIREEDTIATLYERIEHLGLALVAKYLPGLATGSIVLREQDESKRRVFPQRSPEDGRIDWGNSDEAIYNFIRAQTRPYPGAFTSWEGKDLKVWSARKFADIDGSEARIGQILDSSDKLLVQTGDGILELLELSLENQDICASEFLKITGPVILGS